MNMTRHASFGAVFLLCISAGAIPAFALGCLTAECHQAMTTVTYRHEPVAEEDCLACHVQQEPGHPTQAGKSFRISLPGAELCFQCHELADRAEMHPPVADGECLGCHNPHGSSSDHLLNEPLPDLCYQCHDAVRDEVEDKVRHAAVYRAGSCSLCHSGHSSEGPSLLLAPERALCLSCHGQNDYKRSDPLRNIGSEIEGKPYLHGPVADGECSPCHAPHGSPFYRLLRAEYPAGPYSPYGENHIESYNLCFECHDRAMLRSGKVSATETGFRDGKRNLHYLHVADPHKGRICTTCHAAHASTSPKLINDQGARFGSWSIPVNFQPTGTGGSCAPGCHKAAEYDRGKS